MWQPDVLREKIRSETLHGLPGKEAQYIMAPFRRKQREIEVLVEHAQPKLGGILVYLYPIGRQQYHILLTLRNEYKGAHSGQVSFPGGKMEPVDPDLVATALREAREETGVQVLPHELLGSLTNLYIPPSNFLVHPVLAIASQKPILQPDPLEVRRIVPFTVEDLLDEKKVSQTHMELFNKVTVEVPYFEVDGLQVWGATAMILSEVKELLRRVY